MEPITKVDWCFETETKTKGYLLYNSQVINNIIKEKNKYTAIIDNNETMVEFDNSRKEYTSDDHCTCNEYDNNGECKHVYALVCAINKVPKNLEIDYYKIDEEEKENTVSYSFTIDESNLIKEIDEKLASLDSYTLFKMRKELISNNEDTTIIDKAMKERNRRDRIKEREEKEERKQMRRALLAGLFLGSNKVKNTNKNIDNLMPWEQNEVNNGNYEPYNFEEEELEEDDYYYEDNK